MRVSSVAIVSLAFVLAGACGPPAETGNYEDPNGPINWQPGHWTVVWRDEFDGDAGTPPDPTRWTHDIGGAGWGNKELQDYTDSPDNASLDGAGHLLITARAQPTGTNLYTSARLTTKGLFAQAYGRFEARMRLVSGPGFWPAFWIMGDDLDTIGWPGAGEMDIMEERGSVVDSISGSLHGPGALATKTDIPVTRAVTVPGGADADFHVYAVEWDPASIVFLVDDTPYFQITPARRPDYARWAWDHPFFILLNLAVGGYFPGPPTAATVFPTSLVVDDVRVSVRSDSDAGAEDADANADASDAEVDAADADVVAPAD